MHRKSWCRIHRCIDTSLWFLSFALHFWASHCTSGHSQHLETEKSIMIGSHWNLASFKNSWKKVWSFFFRFSMEKKKITPRWSQTRHMNLAEPGCLPTIFGAFSSARHLWHHTCRSQGSIAGNHLVPVLDVWLTQWPPWLKQLEYTFWAKYYNS